MPLTADFLPHTDPLTLGPDLGEACGDNAMNWAKAFCAIAKSRGVDLGDDPEGWMVGWFANAIECADQTRNGTGPVVLPDDEMQDAIGHQIKFENCTFTDRILYTSW